MWNYLRYLWCLFIHRKRAPFGYDAKENTFRCMKCGMKWKEK